MKDINAIVQFAQARTQAAHKILDEIFTLSPPPENPAISAEQWKDAGGSSPLAPAQDVPMREVPEATLNGTPVARPPSRQEMEPPKPVDLPEHMQMALDFIAKNEAFEPLPKQDRWDKKTKKPNFAIGYGSQTDPRDGTPVTRQTKEITESEAEMGRIQRVMEDDKRLDKLLKVDVTPHKRAMLLDMLYNIRPPEGGWANSGLFQLVNSAAPDSELWDKVEEYNKSSDKKGALEHLKGLANRSADRVQLGAGKTPKPWHPGFKAVPQDILDWASLPPKPGTP